MAFENNLPAGSVPFSNQIYKDTNSRIWTGNEFDGEFYRFIDNDDVPYVYLRDFGVVGDGVNDDTQSFLDAINYATNHPYRRYIIGELGKSYKVSQQIVLTIDLVLDLMYSEIIFRGAPIIHLTGYNVTLKNILFNLGANQYAISYADVAQKNLEVGCWTTRGYGYLVEPNIVNPLNFTNRSVSAESVSRGNPVVKTKFYELDVSWGATENSTFTLASFPARCFIHSLSISDVNGSPDFAVDFFYWGEQRGRASEDYRIECVDYHDILHNDLLVCRIVNYKGSATTFRVEAIISEPQYTTENKIWEYSSRRDLVRPHPDTMAPNNTVSIETVRSIEYRYLIAGSLNVKGIIPVRQDDRMYCRSKAVIPTPSGTQDTSMTELKFYFDYSASRAVIDRPTHFRMQIFSVPKETTVSVKNGWYMQNPNNLPEFLKSVPNPTFEITIPASTSLASPFLIEIALDPKAYQIASSLEGARSFNFWYLTLLSTSGQTPILWGEEYMFSAYFIKKQQDL